MSLIVTVQRIIYRNAPNVPTNNIFIYSRTPTLDEGGWLENKCTPYITLLNLTLS